MDSVELHAGLPRNGKTVQYAGTKAHKIPCSDRKLPVAQADVALTAKYIYQLIIGNAPRRDLPAAEGGAPHQIIQFHFQMIPHPCTPLCAEHARFL